MQHSPSLSRSQREVAILTSFKSRVRQIELQQLSQKLRSSDMNRIDYYVIPPKDELPKYLQKLKQQIALDRESIIHTDVDGTKAYKTFYKENDTYEAEARRKIKESGSIMLLSEMQSFIQRSYDHLNENIEPIGAKSVGSTKLIEHCSAELDEWERRLTLERARSNERQQLGAGLALKDGDICSYVQRSLEVIDSTQCAEPNILARLALIESKSKLLKKDLEDKKATLETRIDETMTSLKAARDLHHTLYEERMKLTQLEQKDEPVQASAMLSRQSTFTRIVPDSRLLRKAQIQSIDARIEKAKLEISEREESLAKMEEELGQIKAAEEIYYRVSLRVGTDCRDSGLVWALKQLHGLKQSHGLKPHGLDAEAKNVEFPKYLDKRSRCFLAQRAQLELELDQLLEQKSRFVSEIGKLQERRGCGDRVMEAVHAAPYAEPAIPKKYRRSLKKMSVLNDEYLRTQSILEHQRDDKRSPELSIGLDGLTGSEIYKVVGQKIKNMDFTKVKRERSTHKNKRLSEYQNLLSSIQDIHIKIEDQ